MQGMIETTSPIRRPHTRHRAVALGILAAFAASLAFAPTAGAGADPYAGCMLVLGGNCIGPRARPVDFLKNQAKDPVGVAKSAATTATSAVKSAQQGLICAHVKYNPGPLYGLACENPADRSRAARTAKRRAARLARARQLAR
jgi:hypothetical protein